MIKLYSSRESYPTSGLWSETVRYSDVKGDGCRGPSLVYKFGQQLSICFRTELPQFDFSFSRLFKALFTWREGNRPRRISLFYCLSRFPLHAR